MNAPYILVLPAAVMLRIASDGDATYVDVRTVAEFAAGHPRGQVINVPIEFYHPKTGAAHPNASFELVMRHAVAMNQALIVGADDGPRAARAADVLRQIGFTEVAVMSAGIGGWRASGLPVTGFNAPGTSYVSLLTPAKRAGAQPATEHS
jgi:rhodanese-related sulfurtransferase